MRAAADTLRNWNGQTEKKTAAPMIATLLDTELRKAAAKAAAPGTEDEYAVADGSGGDRKTTARTPRGLVQETTMNC